MMLPGGRVARAAARTLRGLPLLAAAILAGACSDELPALCAASDLTPIHLIQGSKLTTPLLGASVTVTGIVTAHYIDESGTPAGFFVQNPAAQGDGDPATSEGLYVASDRAAPRGDRVVVSGVVVELGQGSETMTTLAADEQARCGSAPALPEAAPLTLPASLERLEAMRVELVGPVTITDVYGLGRYGQLEVAAGGLVFQPTELAPPGEKAREIAQRNHSRSLRIDDGSAAAYPQQIPFLASPDFSVRGMPRVGNRVSELRGVIDGRDGYRLHALQPMNEISRQPQQRFSPPAGTLTVAAFNVLNFFNGDGTGDGFPTSRGADSPQELERQRDKLVAAVLGMGLPDILAVMELENDGYGPSSAIADLTEAINARIRSPRTVYDYVRPGLRRLGDDEIAVGLLWRRDKVRLVGDAATLLEPPFHELNRPPLAQTFESVRNRERLAVVALHLKSKSCTGAQGPDRDQGDGQACFAAARTAAVERLIDWLANDPVPMASGASLLIGDFNAYSQEKPLSVLQQAGFVNLVAKFHREPQYTFIYRGAAGSLDHAFANPLLARRARGARIWHINADYPPWIDYNLEGKTAEQVRALYDPSAVRSSDHDPVLVGFD